MHSQPTSLRRHSLTRQLGLLLGALVLGVLTRPAAWGDDGRLRLRQTGSESLVQVVGDADDDWLIETSSDLVNWAPVEGMPPLLSGDLGSAPERSLGVVGDDAGGVFVRARRTGGLYDPTLLRTVSLTFTQANWRTLLTNARTTGSNVVCDLTLDNGAALKQVGARYKGNTSFQMSGVKKSLNIEMDFRDPAGELLGYSTVNLNNAAGDETILREPLYFTVMSRYTVSPKAALVRLMINGEYWGVYSLAQNGDGDLIREWFQSNDGDRWRTPNAAGGGPGGGGGGGFSSPVSALSWQGTNVARYRSYYELKTSPDPTNAWRRLVHAIDVLNNTPLAELRDTVEEVLAVDRWLWFNAIEIVFADDDSYWNKGADYSFYYEPESGRIHPLEHDGNEAFVAGDVSLSPVQGSTGTNRPVISRLLAVPELRQRYLAHMRTVLEEAFNPSRLTPLIQELHRLSVAAVGADTRKGYTMLAYTNDLNALRSFVTNRHRFLTNHAELRPRPPAITEVVAPVSPVAGTPVTVNARVTSAGEDGLDSVWLYYRPGPTGRFTRTAMLDDGAHADGAAGDGVFGAPVEGYLAGTKVRYYLEARSGNATRTARFAPEGAENETYSYRVSAPASPGSPVILNELQADNQRTLADPQGGYDDWIELRNTGGEEVALGGRYLSDDPNNPRKWRFPDGVGIPPGGYLLVWADEDGRDTPGLHANFKLAAAGEQVLLVDTDENLNAILDLVSFPAQATDVAYGRSASQPERWVSMAPTPGRAND